MNENERYQEEKKQEPDGRQVQQELEDQLRAFGDTMTDAFLHGFEGRGEEIGDRVWDIGKATVHAANYGINAAGRAMREGQRQAEQSGGAAGWARQFFAKKPDPTPVESLRASAKKRRSTGHALFWPGVTFAVIFAISAVSCFGAAAMFATTLAGDVATAVEGDVVTQLVVTGSDAISSLAHGAIQVSAWAFTVVTALFGWMTAAGVERLNASKRLNLYAEMAEGFDYKKGLSVEMLADLTHQKKQKALKLLRKYIHKGWLTAWLDEKEEKLYLTAEDYRAAQAAKRAEAEAAAAAEAAAEKPENDAPLNLETARRFAQVLAQEKSLMQDENAVEELDQMQKTTAAICEWLEGHPESLPKARRFAEYYIPTTLKLLHTYNDVQGQQGENAANIRRDIAGILHTLNQAYRNLYDTLLGDAALDVSSEIAALQGMLANDGLTGGDFQ